MNIPDSSSRPPRPDELSPEILQALLNMYEPTLQPGEEGVPSKILAGVTVEAGLTVALRSAQQSFRAAIKQQLPLVSSDAFQRMLRHFQKNGGKAHVALIDVAPLAQLTALKRMYHEELVILQANVSGDMRDALNIAMSDGQCVYEWGSQDTEGTRNCLYLKGSAIEVFTSQFDALWAKLADIHASQASIRREVSDMLRRSDRR